MGYLNRREFLGASMTGAALSLAGAVPPNKRIGLVTSAHKGLARPASPEDPLDYERVREMVWKAIDYSGGFAGRVRPGSWVVIKPNIVFLRPQDGYRSGDITDFRVTRAVLEYVASHTKAGRVTIAEGGSYRGFQDPAADNAVSQKGVRQNAVTFDWGGAEFPGFQGSLGGMLRSAGEQFRGRKFDYVDLSYDAVRSDSGTFRRVPVPRSANGAGAFGARSDYFVTNTIRNCDFLISVPVMKVHDQCGITGCLKNYVGTAPREAYAIAGAFWNVNLHQEHGLDNRIDGFITDLAAFHPPDFSVVDGIRGLQYQEHNLDRPDQMIRSNLVFAGQDPVSCDSLVAYLLGFNPLDIDFLHMAQSRGMGALDLERADVAGDDPGPLRSRWGKPKRWYGRGNREWLLTATPEQPLEAWKRHQSPIDTLYPAKIAGDAAEYGAAVRVKAEGGRKAYLWVGARGRFVARLNGQTVMQEENLTRYRVGQFQKSIELRSGDNLLEFRIRGSGVEPQISALLVGSRNDGDSVEGIRWRA